MTSKKFHEFLDLHKKIKICKLARRDYNITIYHSVCRYVDSNISNLFPRKVAWFLNTLALVAISSSSLMLRSMVLALSFISAVDSSTKWHNLANVLDSSCCTW